MSTVFIEIWLSWAYYFSALPYSDYVAAFVLVGLVIFAAKKLKSLAARVV